MTRTAVEASKFTRIGPHSGTPAGQESPASPHKHGQGWGDMRHRRIATWAGAVAATPAGTAGMTGCGAGATKKTAGAVSHADAVRAVLPSP
jgi:hypothetical protein